MKSNLKLITSSLIVALTLATPQLVHGTDTKADELEAKLSRITASSGDALVDSKLLNLNDTDQSLSLVEEIIDPYEKSLFGIIVPDAKDSIVKYAAIEQILSPESKFDLALVCKDWLEIIIYDFDNQQDIYKAWYGVIEHEEAFQTFLNGTLIYRPIQDSDEGIIKLKISDLKNPLDGTFDLSQCGDAGKDLSISTGYRKGIRPENKKKLEVWLVPWFLIKKHLDSTACHFKDIMDDWDEKNAAFGIFFTSGHWNNLEWYDYLTRSTPYDITSKNLSDNWWRSRNHPYPPPKTRCIFSTPPHTPPKLHQLPASNFMFIFELK